MGQSQSYDLQNVEQIEKSGETVRGVRRVYKEHETVGAFYDSDPRENELREQLRQQRLKEREEELMTWRRNTNEGREPIIDAYRSTSPPMDQGQLSPSGESDVDHIENLHKHDEVNNGDRIPIIMEHNDSSEKQSVRSITNSLYVDKKHKKKYNEEKVTGYPAYQAYSGRVSPLMKHEEVLEAPMPRYIPPMVPTYDEVPDEPEPNQNIAVSEIHAEKRMLVELNEPQVKHFSSAVKKDFPTYSQENEKICEQEQLKRHPEVEKIDYFLKPRNSYSNNNNDKYIQCDDDYCTHIEVPDVHDSFEKDLSPYSMDNESNSRSLSSPASSNEENNPNAFLSKEKDLYTRKFENRISEEKLYYNSHLPTISLDRKPKVGYYHKLPAF